MTASATRSGPLPLWVVSRVFPPDEGGVQTYAQSLAQAYAAQGHAVRVFTKTSIGPRRLKQDGIDILDVRPGPKWRVYLRLFAALWQARRTARAEGRSPTAIHACTWRAAIVPALLGLAPLTVTVHGREIGRPSGFSGYLLHRVLQRADRIVAVSGWTRAHLIERFPDLAARTVVAWNGLSSFAQLPQPQDPASLPTVLTVCRHVPRKNLLAALEAVALCLRRGARFRYRIGGRGPETERLRTRIEALGIGEHVDLLGFVPDERMAGLYGSADVFLHPQIELEDGAEMEGFGIAIADAMAFGTPCIVGRHGGPAELVEDGVTGRVVDGQDVEAIAQALSQLLADDAARIRMGEAARDWANRSFGWDRHARLSLGEPLTEVPA